MWPCGSRSTLAEDRLRRKCRRLKPMLILMFVGFLVWAVLMIHAGYQELEETEETESRFLGILSRPDSNDAVVRARYKDELTKLHAMQNFNELINKHMNNEHMNNEHNHSNEQGQSVPHRNFTFDSKLMMQAFQKLKDVVDTQIKQQRERVEKERQKKIEENKAKRQQNVWYYLGGLIRNAVNKNLEEAEDAGKNMTSFQAFLSKMFQKNSSSLGLTDGTTMRVGGTSGIELTTITHFGDEVDD